MSYDTYVNFHTDFLRPDIHNCTIIVIVRVWGVLVPTIRMSASLDLACDVIYTWGGRCHRFWAQFVDNVDLVFVVFGVRLPDSDGIFSSIGGLGVGRRSCFESEQKKARQGVELYLASILLRGRYADVLYSFNSLHYCG